MRVLLLARLLLHPAMQGLLISPASGWALLSQSPTAGGVGPTMQSMTRRHVSWSGRPLKLASAPEACLVLCSCSAPTELPLLFLHQLEPFST